jgi:hypothetical protein
VRREAGFTEDELEDLKTLSSGGPSRETMRAAAKIVRERHLARTEQVSRSEPKASEDHEMGSA